MAAATATLPKTIFITTLPNSTNIQQKIGIKRPFQLISSSSPISVTTLSQQQSPSINSVLKSSTTSSPPHSLTNNSNGNTVWIPATTTLNSFRNQTPKICKIEEDYDDDDYDDFSDEQNNYIESNGQPSRKRERLTHLTAEEKMYRRKLKNRIAAQTARDRKKALMSELEETCRRLEEENDALLNENSKLKQNQCTLAEENTKLKKLLEDQQQKQGLANKIVTDQDNGRSTLAIEPAEFINDPLPKEQAKAEWALTWLAAFALIQICSKFCDKSLPDAEKMRVQLEELKENRSITLEDVLQRSPPECIEKLWKLIQFHKRKKPPWIQ